MAEAVIEVVLENLSSLAKEELGLLLGVDQEINRLSSTLTTIKAVLEDAEEKQLADRATKNWVQKLKDAAHVLDDILDEFSTEALELEYQHMRCGSANKMQSPCLSAINPKHFCFATKLLGK